MRPDERKAQSMQLLWRITALGLLALLGAGLGISANFVDSHHGSARVVLPIASLVLLTVSLVLMFRLRRELRSQKRP